MAIKTGSSSTTAAPPSATPPPADPPPATPAPEPAPQATPPPSASASSPSPGPRTQGPTGKMGFLAEETTLSSLEKKASSLSSAYRGVSSRLSGLTLSWNSLGMIGTPFVGALNGSNAKSVDNANQAADSFEMVSLNLKATSRTYRDNDARIASQFRDFEPDADASVSGTGGITRGGPSSITTTAGSPGPGGKVREAPELNGGPAYSPAPAPTPAPGGQVSDVPQINGGPNTTTSTAGAPSPQGPVTSAPEVRGGPNTVPSPAPAPAPQGPIAAPPQVRGGTAPAAARTPPPGAWAPNPGGYRGPAAPPVTDTTHVTAMWPPAGPRPGAVPNVPGVVGPPQGIFAPSRPAADALRPINQAYPPSEPRPTGPRPDLPFYGPENKPFEPPKPGVSPDPYPVQQVKAPKNILDLLDPRGYPDGAGHGHPNGYKTDPAWPATTIDGKPWADLQNLTPEESRKWIDNLRNVLASKPNGAFFWSGNYYDSEGNRISVMDEAGYMAHAGGRNTLEGTLDDRAIKLPGWGNTSPEGKAVWDSVSASLAHGASGDVYVLLGPTRRPDNVFHMTEFPILQENQRVTRVIAIDVLTKEETVIFTRT